MQRHKNYVAGDEGLVIPQIDSAMLVSTLFVLLGLASAWGSLWAQLRGINYRLDSINGSIVDHEKRINQTERDISHIQGAREEERHQ